MNTSLFIHEAPPGLTLTRAIAFWVETLRAGRHTIGLVYTPTACSFVAVGQDGCLRCCPREAPFDGGPSEVDAGEVYEARLFNSTAELRWLNEPGGAHRSVLIAERSFGVGARERSCLGWIRQTYVIWGKPHAAEEHPADYPAGWTRFSTARIGVLDVPLAGVPSNRRAALVAREYLDVIDQHGNVVVVEERLLRVASVRIRIESTGRRRPEGR